MAERYLIDTCAVIKYLNDLFPEAGASFIDHILALESNISFITEIELQVWNPTNPEDLIIYQNFIDQSTKLKVDDNVIITTIAIRKKHKVKIPDAIIAATALVKNYTLVSDNDGDFTKIENLKYINPKSISAA